MSEKNNGRQQNLKLVIIAHNDLFTQKAPLADWKESVLIIVHAVRLSVYVRQEQRKEVSREVLELVAIAGWWAVA